MKRNVNGDILTEYENSEQIIGSLGFNHYKELVSTNQDGAIKKVLLDGYVTTPTVKETTFIIKNGDFLIQGIKDGNYAGDITDIIIKANTVNEGMAVGVSSNGMGYIVAQNFRIDCSKLTDSERTFVQSLDAIRFSVANNSNDYPLLKPNVSDSEAGVFVIGKNGNVNLTTKMQIQSNNSYNYFQYNLPSEFKKDDNSSNNLLLATKEWISFVGINIKKYN